MGSSCGRPCEPPAAAVGGVAGFSPALIRRLAPDWWTVVKPTALRWTTPSPLEGLHKERGALIQLEPCTLSLAAASGKFVAAKNRAQRFPLARWRSFGSQACSSRRRWRESRFRSGGRHAKRMGRLDESEADEREREAGIG